jgi:hypothetical protein
MAYVRSDGRITADVMVRGKSVSLIVDTGAEASALPFMSIPPSARGATSYGPITFVVAGTMVHTVNLTGVRADAAVEQHGGGRRRSVTTNSDVRVHFGAAGAVPFVGFDGIMGIDMLDDIQADPTKNFAGTTALLARRV